MQCIIVKGGERCTQDSEYQQGCTLPIIKPEIPPVFICVVCIDEMQFVAHQSEAKLMEPLNG